GGTAPRSPGRCGPRTRSLPRNRTSGEAGIRSGRYRDCHPRRGAESCGWRGVPLGFGASHWASAWADHPLFTASLSYPRARELSTAGPHGNGLVNLEPANLVPRDRVPAKTEGGLALFRLRGKTCMSWLVPVVS